MTPISPMREARGVWSTSEHERFLEALTLYPQGPWHLITAHIGTRSAKQVQTHAQKYQHKLLRHKRGLRKWKTRSKRPEHRVDTSTIGQFTNGWLIGPIQRKSSTLDATRRADELSSSADESSSEYSDAPSDGYAFWDLDSMLDAIEPVPFRSTSPDTTAIITSNLVDPDDQLVREALDMIMSWPSPSPVTTATVFA